MASDDFVPSGTGVGTHLKILAPELVKRGHSVSIVTTRRKGQASEEVWEGVRVFRVFSMPAYGFYQALPSKSSLLRIIDLVHPDLVHHHYVGYLMMRLCGIAESLEIPQVSTYHFSSEVLTQPLLMRPFASLVRKLLVSYNNRFGLIIAPSRNLASQIARDGIDTPIRSISNPVVFKAARVPIKSASNDDFTILYAGRLGVEKNLPLLLRAYARLRSVVRDAVVQIAGHGPELGALQDLCSELGISDGVHFLGFLDHQALGQRYAGCDVFVLPSVVETQGLVAMEAMRFSKPIIVTSAIVSAEELVTEGLNGFIVDPQDSQQLADRLAILAGNRELRASMGHESAIRSEAYRPELVVTETESAYRAVMASSSAIPKAA